MTTTGKVSDGEVRAALDVLQRAGWEVEWRQGFGFLLDGGLLVPACEVGEQVRTYRARIVEEPWTEGAVDG